MIIQVIAVLNRRNGSGQRRQSRGISSARRPGHSGQGQSKGHHKSRSNGPVPQSSRVHDTGVTSSLNGQRSNVGGHSDFQRTSVNNPIYDTVIEEDDGDDGDDGDLDGDLDGESDCEIAGGNTTAASSDDDGYTGNSYIHNIIVLYLSLPNYNQLYFTI